jgi:hypothetical protein
MAELFAFGGEIARGMRTAGYFGASAFDNFDPGSEHGTNLLRIIRHQAHGPNFEEKQDLNGKTIISQVDGVA